MSVTVATIAQAVVDTARILPVEEHAALADAAATILRDHGLLRERRTFLLLVEKLWQKQEGVTPVKIVTTHGTADEQTTQLISIVEKAIGKRCVAEQSADPSVLGGIRLTIGDDQFDATLRHSLVSLAERLTAPISLPS